MTQGGSRGSGVERVHDLTEQPVAGAVGYRPVKAAIGRVADAARGNVGRHRLQRGVDLGEIGVRSPLGGEPGAHAFDRLASLEHLGRSRRRVSIILRLTGSTSRERT
jgi:hypothetical protein